MQVFDGAAWSAVPAAQHRLLLAVLLVEAGRVVTTDRLIEELWGVAPPRRAASTVQVYVGRLRRLMGDTAHLLVTRGHGYQLAVQEGDLDAYRFERLVAAGQAARGQGHLVAAVDQISDGLALWRGAAMADVPANPTVMTEAARLEGRRLTSLEERLAAQLDLGRHADVMDELAKLVTDHPLRERLWAQYMLALYRCGRRADALDAYRAARRVLVAELGLEPGPELRELERAVLHDAPRLAGPVQLGFPALRTVPPAQLPSDIAGFTGRGDYLRRLDALADRSPSGTVAVIDGTAGVGKTTLAVRWAHSMRDRFPDGQLYVNLRGYAAGPPLRPLDALAGFLRAMGVPPEQVPIEMDEAAALYRSLLAGKKMLVLLDNARHPDQVRPLLPGEAACMVVVTSRDRLDGLLAVEGADRISLETLPPQEAVLLLERLLGRKRVQAEPEPAAQLARLCGGLPLALRIAAANLAGHPARGIAGLTARLLAGDRLAALDVDGDATASVRATFDLSYEALPAETQRLFRLLGLVPGTHVTAEAAAALTGMSPDRAGRLLDRLTATHLIQETAPQRYALHDLLRAYAAGRAVAEDAAPRRDAAVRGLHDFYLHTLDAAATRLYPHIFRVPVPAAGAPPASFEDHTDALAWLEAEHPNLVATIVHAAEHGHSEMAWRLADALRGYLDLGMHTADWTAVAQAAHTAARADGDPRGHAAAHLSMATLHWISSRYQWAIDHFNEALRLSREADWPHAGAVALGNLGAVYWHLGSLPRAAEHYTQALALDRESGRTRGQAIVAANLGLVHLASGQTDSAIKLFREAIERHRAGGSHLSGGRAVACLGEAYRALGDLGTALSTLDDALAMHREVGDRLCETDTTRMLALTLNDLGRYPDAAEHAETAVTLAQETANQLTQAEALIARATVHLYLGQPQPAIADCVRALDLARQIGNEHIQADALIALAAARNHTGGHQPAADLAREALAITRRDGYRPLEGNALTVLAAACLGQDRPHRAVAHAGEALAVHEETGNRLGRARAHLVAERAHQALGRDGQAQDHRRAAWDLFGQMGVEGGHHARALLGRSPV